MNHRAEKRFVVAILAIAMFFAGFLFSAQVGVANADEDAAVVYVNDGLSVHFVDVGQGDACIIEFPDNKTMLIDAGENHKSSKDALLAYIKDNINQPSGEDILFFDYVILTHPDSDHCGGMADVLAKYPAKVFYRPNVYTEDKNLEDAFADPREEIKAYGNANIKDTLVYYNAIKAGYNEDKVNDVETTVHITDATNEAISVIEPQGIAKTDAQYYSFTFYAPIEKSFSGDGQWNNYSPIMILEYQNKRFAFSGDAEKKALASFVTAARGGQGKYAVFDETYTVDVFKLGHHGSENATTADYLETLTTDASCPNVLAVISCGEGNKYKHPHQEALDILISHGFKEENILRTDVVSTIRIAVRGTQDTNGQTVWGLYLGETEKEPPASSAPDATASPHGTFFLTKKQWIILALIVIAVLIVVFIVSAQGNHKRHSGHGKKGARR